MTEKSKAPSDLIKDHKGLKEKVRKLTVKETDSGAALPGVFGTALNSGFNISLHYDQDYYDWMVPLRLGSSYEDDSSPGWSIIDPANFGVPTVLIPPEGEVGDYIIGVNGWISLYGSSQWPLVQGAANTIDSSLTGRKANFGIEASLLVIGQTSDSQTTNWTNPHGDGISYYRESDWPASGMEFYHGILGDSIAISSSMLVTNMGRLDPSGDGVVDKSVAGVGFWIADGRFGDRSYPDGEFAWGGTPTENASDLTSMTAPAFKASYFRLWARKIG